MTSRNGQYVTDLPCVLFISKQVFLAIACVHILVLCCRNNNVGFFIVIVRLAVISRLFFLSICVSYLIFRVT